jgi:hypothetical protein
MSGSEPSRPPQNNSAKTAEGKTPDSAKAGEKSPLPDDLPTPAERVAEVIEEFPDRAHRPLCETHGEELRPECVEETTETFEVVTDDGAKVRRENVEKREAVALKTAVRRMLDWHAQYHNSSLLMEYGRETDPTHDLMMVDMDNSWMVQYQKTERARLKALERETCGFDTCGQCVTRWCQHPDDHETEWVAGVFEKPVVVLTGRTASGAGRAPVDHARSISDAWSDGGVRRALRHVADSLGLGSHEWVRWTQGEPHTGKRASAGHGGNLGLHHVHDIIILDGAAADDDVTPGTFRNVIERHVEECAGAGAEAHDLHIDDWDANREDVGTVEVKEVNEEIEESVASYAASYLANESLDLLERSTPYLVWAATMWATGSRKSSGTDSRTHAIEADRCHHKHHNEDQSLAHGEQVRREPCRCATQAWGPGCSRCDGTGHHIVCSMCGSQWAIDQSQTLAAARMNETAVAADGGVEEDTAEDEKREKWPSAREFAAVGGPTRTRECGHEKPDTCPLCATETEAPEHTVDGMVPIPDDAKAPSPDDDPEAVAFTRPPSWSVKAVVRDGEELAASGGTLEKRPLKLPGAPEMVAAMSLSEAATLKCMDCGCMFDHPAGYADHGECADRGHVGVGWLAPTEPLAEEGTLEAGEYLEAVPDRLLEGGGRADDVLEASSSDGHLTDELAETIRRAAERDENATVPQLLGTFDLPPEAAGRVESLVSAD